MKKIFLTSEKIKNIISKSDTISKCMVNLYCTVISDKWEDIRTFNDHPTVSRNTAHFILEEMGRKWDKTTINMLWLDKGFSNNNLLKDWIVEIPDNCYELVDKKKEVDNFIMAFAQVEVEEIGSEPENNSIFYD